MWTWEQTSQFLKVLSLEKVFLFPRNKALNHKNDAVIIEYEQSPAEGELGVLVFAQVLSLLL